MFVDETPLDDLLGRRRHSEPRRIPASARSTSRSPRRSTSTTFTTADLSLTDNGGPNLITSAVTISLVSGTTSTYEIGGLSGLTTAEGTYVLTVNASGIQDEAGNCRHRLDVDLLADGHDAADQHGQLAAAADDVDQLRRLGHAAPTRPAPNGSTPRASRRSPSMCRRTAGPSASRHRHARRPLGPLHRPGRSLPTASTASRPTTPATSSRRRPRPSRPSRSSPLMPQLDHGRLANPRNTAVSAIDVTFSEPINTSSLAAGALTLTDNGGPNLINGARHDRAGIGLDLPRLAGWLD